MEVMRGILARAEGRQAGTGNEDGLKKADPGKGLAGLGSAVQVLVSFVVLLPVIGGVVLFVEYLTVSSIPAPLAFSESPGGLVRRGWLVLLVALGPFIAVWLAQLQGPKLKVVLPRLLLGASVVLALLVPFPHVAVPVIVMGVLAAWFLWRLSTTNGPSTPAVALAVIVGGFIAAMALGLAPSGGQPVYIQSSNQAVIPTGWYVELTDSSDPLYLLSCSGGKVAAVPKDDVLIKTYGAARLSNVSLWDVLGSTPLPHMGLTPACPTVPPPSW